MHSMFKLTALGIAAFVAAPGLAGGSIPQWWLVIDESDTQTASFVDLASMAQSPNGVRIIALTLDRSGQRETSILNVECGQDGGGQTAIDSFVCGSEEYRNGNGLMLGPVSPDEMAKTVFATQPGETPARGFYEA